MIIVTGGAGFIGSNLVRALNQRGRADILVVDNLRNGAKYRNLADCEIADYWSREAFLAYLEQDGTFDDAPEAVFHQGACTVTTEWDGQYMMQNNFEYSKVLFHYCDQRGIPFMYASSAATYGLGPVFREERQFEAPLNVYGYSKFLFDQYVHRHRSTSASQVAGFRYFNVYGPREAHKGPMASVAFHFRNQLLADGVVRLFEGCDGFDHGEQRRDFVYVHDVVAVNLWFMDHPEVSGVYNVGTGRSQTFNEVARAVIAWHGHGEIEYIPFPDHLRGSYQSFTEADLGALRDAGYADPFMTVEEGVPAFMDAMAAGPGN